MSAVNRLRGRALTIAERHGAGFKTFTVEVGNRTLFGGERFCSAADAERLKAFGQGFLDLMIEALDELEDRERLVAELEASDTVAKDLAGQVEALAVELAAARLFGGGFFADVVSENTREAYRRLARQHGASGTDGKRKVSHQPENKVSHLGKAQQKQTLNGLGGDPGRNVENEQNQ